MRFGILKKFLAAFLAMSLLPLLVLGFYAREKLDQLGQSAVASSTQALVKTASSLLEARARGIAHQVQVLLEGCCADLGSLSLLPFDADLYQQFCTHHRRQIWQRSGTRENPSELWTHLPLYRQITFADSNGIERIRIEQNRRAPTEWDVARPFRGPFGEEDYFRRARNLPPGQIYVSHLLGRHVKMEEQLQGASRVEDAYGGREFEGIIRFAMPVHRDGRFQGVVSLALDHRHMMALTQHVLPIGSSEVIFPSYTSGNYAFLFDDEGWIITHPKFWDIRGHDPASGQLVDPLSAAYNEDAMRAGQIPFNLMHVPFIHRNYQHIAREVMAGNSGVTVTASVGGVSRVLAYAPIHFHQGAYKQAGLFGGVTLGARTETFHQAVDETATVIHTSRKRSVRNFILIILMAGLVVSLIAVALARSFTRPILMLADKVKGISRGHFNISVDIHSGDELELLGRNFQDMSHALQDHQQHLLRSLEELEASKRAIETSNRRLLKQVGLLKNIQHVGHMLSLNFVQEQVYSIILKTCVAGIGFERALIYLYNPRSRLLECVKTFGFTPEDQARALKAAYEIGKHACAPTQVFTSGKPLVVQDAGSGPNTTPLDRKIASVSQVHAYAFSPIQIGERAIGVLGADNARSRRPISEEEVESLKIIANEAAMAIERARLMDQAVKERDFIESIFTNMMSGLVIVDHNRILTAMNHYAERVLKVAAAESIGQPSERVLAAYPPLLAVLTETLQTQAPASRDLALALPGGGQKFLEVSVSTLKGSPAGQEKIGLLIFQDVTERKKLERHLRRSDRLVSIGTLAAGIAHEIRNPLTGISLMLDDLHDRMAPEGTGRPLIQRALEEIEKLETLVTELLEFAAAPTSRLAAQDINAVIDHTLFLVKKQCARQGVALICETSALPPVRLDPEKLKQALLNILLNALNVLPDGGRITITTTACETLGIFGGRGAVEIRLCDNGPGISPDDIDYIFDPFFTRTPKGFGLGLAIAHTIVEEHSGKILVESRPGRGTCFKIYFPVSEDGTQRPG